MKINDFLRSCKIGTISPRRKRWQGSSIRTRKSPVSKAKDLVVAALNIIVPSNAGHLWKASKSSNYVERELQTGHEEPYKGLPQCRPQSPLVFWSALHVKRIANSGNENEFWPRRTVAAKVHVARLQIVSSWT